MEEVYSSKLHDFQNKVNQLTRTIDELQAESDRDKRRLEEVGMRLLDSPSNPQNCDS